MILVNGEWYSAHDTIKCNKEYCERSTLVKIEKLYGEESKADDATANDYDNAPTKEYAESEPDEKFEPDSLLLPDPELIDESEPNVSTQSQRKPLPKAKPPAKKVAPKQNVSTSGEGGKKKREPATKFVEHRPKTSITCDICQKVLSTFNSLRAHMVNMHIPNVRKRFECPVCKLSLANPGTLKQHLVLHEKSKAFVCPYCGRGFNQLYNLKQHQNHHTGVKPYKCNLCEKAFGRKSNLVSHTRVHTGEKPFRCHIMGCDRAYMFDIDLKRHKYSVHQIYTKKHICTVCSKVYPENKLLQKHLKTHTGFS